MRLFRTKQTGVVGVDIGSRSIKLVELAGNYKRPKVIAWGIAPLPAGAFSDSTISDSDAISEALNQLLISTNAKSNNIAVAVSSSQAITKILGMPADMRKMELEEQVSVEALHFIPYPIDEVNIDFEVIGPSAQNADENDVLLVACRRSIVDDYIDVVEDIGLELRYVDIDTYALERAYRTQNNATINAKTPIALFDIGSANSHLMVLDDERVIYSRHQSFGAADLVKLIRKEYDITADEAEEVLRTPKLPHDFNQKVQEPFVQMLQIELRRALQFFYSSSSVADVDHIVLAGATSALDGIELDLEKQMRTKVKTLDPLGNATIRARREAAKRVAPSLAVAYGLALRGLA